MTNTVSAGVTVPARAVVYDSVGIHHQTLKVESGNSNYLPGALVIQGTNDDDLSLCGANGGALAIGFLGYEGTAKKYQPDAVTDYYATDDQADVINGPGIILAALIATGNNIPKGTLLVAAANGTLTAASAAAPPTGSTPMTSTGAQATNGGCLPTEGLPVAKLYESVNTSGTVRALVMSLI